MLLQIISGVKEARRVSTLPGSELDEVDKRVGARPADIRVGITVIAVVEEGIRSHA